jgi:hypothetical protein
MSAPPNTFANLLGHLLYQFHADPQTAKIGKGLGIIFDLARNAPAGLVQNIPYYDASAQPATIPVPPPTPGSMPNPGG